MPDQPASSTSPNKPRQSIQPDAQYLAKGFQYDFMPARRNVGQQVCRCPMLLPATRKRQHGGPKFGGQFVSAGRKQMHPAAQYLTTPDMLRTCKSKHITLTRKLQTGKQNSPRCVALLFPNMLLWMENPAPPERFSCNYQPTMVSHGFKVVRGFIHPQHEGEAY